MQLDWTAPIGFNQKGQYQCDISMEMKKYLTELIHVVNFYEGTIDSLPVFLTPYL